MGTLLKYYENAEEALRKRYQTIAETLQKRSHNVLEMLTIPYGIVIRMLWKMFT